LVLGVINCTFYLQNFRFISYFGTLAEGLLRVAGS